MTDTTIKQSTDDNLLAAIAHFFGFFVALIIWAIYKDKSPYVRFQSIQAMAIDLVAGVLMFVGAACLITMALAFLGMGVGDIAIFGSQNNPTAEPVRVIINLMQGLPFLAACAMTVFGIGLFIIRLVATVQTFLGKDFHYPWLGMMIEKWLKQ